MIVLESGTFSRDTVNANGSTDCVDSMDSLAFPFHSNKVNIVDTVYILLIDAHQEPIKIQAGRFFFLWAPVYINNSNNFIYFIGVDSVQSDCTNLLGGTVSCGVLSTILLILLLVQTIWMVYMFMR